MFKGYIPTRNKRPAESIKGRKEFYKFDEVKHLKSYGGVLADDIIMVDIDNMNEAETMQQIVNELNIKCNIIETSRGKHFYFKNTNIRKNSIHQRIAIGLNVDIKLGDRNCVVPLKIDGTERKFLQKYDELDSLPKWIYVMKKDIDFNDLSEGDGRNQTLFNYILTLQSEGFSKDEIRETIAIINNYIISEPLDSKELEIILRDEAFNKESFFKGSQLLHDKYARFIMSEEHVVSINDTLHVYHDGIYTSKPRIIEGKFIKHLPMLTKAKRSEVLSYLELIAPDKELVVNSEIVVNNGILNLDGLTIRAFDENYICRNKLSVNYVNDAYNEVMDKTLNKIANGDKKLRFLMEEMIGYCFLRRNELGKFFILTGSGSNGKSTFLKLIKQIIGRDNISSISLSQIEHRFKTAELFGKLVNIGDDISGNYIEENETLKKLVSGDSVNVERKGGHPFDFDNYSKLIFSCNKVPRINDTTDGLMRRLVIVPFNAKFSNKDDDFDPFIMDKLLSKEALEYLLKISVDGLIRVLKNNGFTKVDVVEKELKEYEIFNNPVLGFLEEFDIVNQPIKDTYIKYSAWCIENNYKPLSSIQFGREVCNKGYERKQMRIKNDRIYIYIRKESCTSQ